MKCSTCLIPCHILTSSTEKYFQHYITYDGLSKQWFFFVIHIAQAGSLPLIKKLISWIL